MANSLPLGIDRVGAIVALDRWLVGTLGARLLEKVRIGSSGGWRVDVQAAGQHLELDIEIPSNYPRGLPRIFLVDPPPFATWPHVESSGRLCITSPADRYDRDQPVEVVRALLQGALDILERGISHANQEDFRTEFLSYWNLDTGGTAGRSILDPSGSTRKIKVWHGKRGDLLAEGSAEIRLWLGNLGTKNNVADSMIKDAALLWFDRALLPSEYPKTVQDLYGVAALAEGDAGQLLDRLLKASTGPLCTVVLGADSGNGTCFGGIELELRRIDRGPKKKGRRAANPSPEVRLSQWKNALLKRKQISRADPFWIHGRDTNPDLLGLRNAKVAVVGCGSLGSQVARLLALGGLGELRLIDPELLEWANVGRHVLGASEEGQFKANALARQLRREFPHSKFSDYSKRWQDCAEALEGCDLIVSTTGILDEEAELTTWQREHPGVSFVFGWTEPRACASQVVAIMPGAGCFLCGFDQIGNPEFQATKWDEVPMRREAACGSWFMPYGADEIISAAVLTTNMALDVLTERAEPGSHRVTSARDDILASAGGVWTENWRAATVEGGPGGRTVERNWLPNMQCPACRGTGPA